MSSKRKQTYYNILYYILADLHLHITHRNKTTWQYDTYLDIYRRLPKCIHLDPSKYLSRHVVPSATEKRPRPGKPRTFLPKNLKKCDYDNILICGIPVYPTFIKLQDTNTICGGYTNALSWLKWYIYIPPRRRSMAIPPFPSKLSTLRCHDQQIQICRVQQAFDGWTVSLNPNEMRWTY